MNSAAAILVPAAMAPHRTPRLLPPRSRTAAWRGIFHVLEVVLAILPWALLAIMPALALVLWAAGIGH